MTTEKETWALDWDKLLSSKNEEHIEIVSRMWREYLSYLSMSSTDRGNLLPYQSMRNTLLENLKSKGHLKKIKL